MPGPMLMTYSDAAGAGPHEEGNRTMLVHWNPGKHFIHLYILTFILLFEKKKSLCFVCVDSKKPLPALDKAIPLNYWLTAPVAKQ